MPYKIKGKCIYKKHANGQLGKRVGCTKGDVDKYMAALQANVKENFKFGTVFEIEILSRLKNHLK
jgi:hypothetical protein